MTVLAVILRALLKLGTCIIGGGLAAWIIVGGIVSLFFSTRVMNKNDFVSTHKYVHNNRRCPICARNIVEVLPFTPKKSDFPSFGEITDSIDYEQNPRLRVKYRPGWKIEAQAFAVYFGLLCGIAWAIENNKARWRFFWSSSGGVSVGWVVHLATGNASVCWALMLLGLFAGIVLSLASVGAYGKK